MGASVLVVVAIALLQAVDRVVKDFSMALALTGVTARFQLFVAHQGTASLGRQELEVIRLRHSKWCLWMARTGKLQRASKAAVLVQDLQGFAPHGYVCRSLGIPNHIHTMLGAA